MPDYTPLFFWVKERERIRVSKESGQPFPWTEDPILGTYSFCNVRREDDRVTRWIHDNIRVPFANHPNLWFMLMIARQINWPGMLASLMHADMYPGAWPDHDAFHPSNMTNAMNDQKSMGLKIYTGAYMISAPSTKGADKQQYICEEVLGKPWAQKHRIEFVLDPTRNPTIYSTHKILTEYNGWGNFMAYQAIVDMRFTRLLENASDRETWCAAGPGTIRGLNRLHGRALDKIIDQSQARTEIREIWKVIREETGVQMDFSDVPNCLCETDKYLRVKNGEGKPRALYKPRPASVTLPAPPF